jgi:hypothetical protein
MCRKPGLPGPGDGLGSVVVGDYVDDSTVAHGEKLPSLYAAAVFLSRPVSRHHKSGQNRLIPEYDDLGNPSSDSRVSAAPVPGQNLLAVLAGGHRIVVGRTPTHVGIEKTAERGEIGRLESDLDLLREALNGFWLLGHRHTLRKGRGTSDPSATESHGSTPAAARQLSLTQWVTTGRQRRVGR